MCHLLTDSSVEVQKMAYQLLHEAAKKRTEYLVIEFGVDSEDIVEAQLPTELINILQQHLNPGDGFEYNESVRPQRHIWSLPLIFRQSILGYLVGWLLAFDLFTDAVGLLHISTVILSYQFFL